ncbi:tRNAse Z TRZ4, mitochondrial [Psilocybe cubensis]|uniref:tRNAse Z TRZ4, mitochondrial n=2 Tax=Psilocybe cubensis TaxID=181762 RepID=A0ACB8GVC6_PSICU|nr:tRNAse Z TRZ4, mitochondrial [Psilocybe cubensis]KAH9479322.1 tRNAse Z TRZ4, mitochondrial [Psilocybe cubensis]
MNWSSSVLTSVSSDTEPCIIVTFDNAKYIFNTSENTTRAFLQTGRNWKRTRALFYTQARIEKVGGFPGLLMTFADATIENLNVFAPPGFNHILASMRFYTYRDTINIKSTELPWVQTAPSSSPKPCYTDDNLKVYSIPVLPEDSASSSEKTRSVITSESTDLMDCETSSDASGKRKREPSPDFPHKKHHVEDTKRNAPGKILYSDALWKAMQKEGFKPEFLTGELADEYRSAIIRSMFPNTRPNSLKTEKKPKPQQGKKKDSKDANVVSVSPQEEEKVDIDDYKRSTKISPPPGFRLQLPNPESNLRSSTNPPAMSYILVGPQYRGKFNAQRALELGIPNGKLRSQLAQGQTVTFEVKEEEETIIKTVRPEEVLGVAEKTAAIVILDVPSVAHISSLISSFQESDFYQKFWAKDPAVFETTEREYNMRVVYHMCGPGVLEDKRYKAFMHGFGPIAHHIIGSREHCADPVTFTSAAHSHLRLKALDEKIFHIPKYNLTPKKPLSEVSGLPPNVIEMKSTLKINMRPWTPPEPDPEVVKRDKFHPIVTGTLPLEFSLALKESIKEVKQSIAQVEAQKDKSMSGEPGANVGVITLGTGGSLPSKYRNVLSTLITVPKYGNILLDAGEGTWGQMVRNFGLEDSTYNVWQALRDLKCIFISHMHADHHIGLANILAKRKLLDPPPDQPLYVVTIRGVHMYLREMNAVQDIGLDDPSGNGVVPVLSESVHYNSRNGYTGQGIWHIGGDEPWLDYTTSVKNGKRMRASLGLESFQTVDVFHRCRCFGVVFRHTDGWSIAFSADTAPSESLCRRARKVTVLIHEATMADEEAELAKKKNHSTIGQAIAEGKKLDLRMDAKNIVLTHFSARYPKMPPYLTKNTPTPSNFAMQNAIVPTFDHVNLTIGDMWKMQFYMPSVNHNFSDTFDQDEDDDVATPTGNVSLG